jgi:EAL domain-containing protein (putative c-di-GMP-specific phosphodiesterase class I)
MRSAEAALPPEGLELEITESMVMQNPERAVSTLSRLRELGISVSIDDFGTGYSSLGYLKRFPIDNVKIDRSFIKDLPHDTDDAAITRAVIAMAQSLRIRVVAEGVGDARAARVPARARVRRVPGLFREPSAAAVRVRAARAHVDARPSLAARRAAEADGLAKSVGRVLARR